MLTLFLPLFRLLLPFFSKVRENIVSEKGFANGKERLKERSSAGFVFSFSSCSMTAVPSWRRCIFWPNRSRTITVGSRFPCSLSLPVSSEHFCSSLIAECPMGISVTGCSSYVLTVLPMPLSRLPLGAFLASGIIALVDNVIHTTPS
jgi:hypothetical protein